MPSAAADNASTVPVPLDLGEREWRLAFAIGLRVLGVPDQAEDIAQETMLRAHRARHTYDGRASPDGWLRRIAFNTALSHIRARQRERRCWRELAQSERPTGAAPTSYPSPEEAAAYRELVRAFALTLPLLTGDSRAAIVAIAVLGASTNDVAALLRATANAAKQRTFRARRVLRSALDPHLH
jgi:RNA polymerase sigma-70 factor (ECF subfamily)